MSLPERKPKLLLHICCAGCGAYISEVLRDDYNVSFYFYNPGIYPRVEYERRFEETKWIAKKFKVSLIEGEYNHAAWRVKVKGHENEPEKGKRCQICYQDRLEETASLAQEKGFSHFTTTLTVSPHKVASVIFMIGDEKARKYNLEFLDQDFKKLDGFKKASELSRKLNLYRQDYCGCEFSLRNTN